MKRQKYIKAAGTYKAENYSKTKRCNYYTTLARNNRKTTMQEKTITTLKKSIEETLFINYGKKSNLKSTKWCNSKSKESLEVLIEKKCFEATLEAA